MIGRLLDNVIAAFSPAAGVRRAQARKALEVATRGYDGARTDRRNKHWRTGNKSADLEMLGDADVIRARARDLARNNPIAKAALKAVVRNVVGEGIFPNPDTGDDARDELLEEEFGKWCSKADITGRLSFYEMQALAQIEMDEAGECLVRFVEMGDGPLQLELIEADRIADNYLFPRDKNPETGNEVRRGVEVDEAGKPVAYWLYENHPNDTHAQSWAAKRYPADEFLHLFRTERIGQTRGISSFAPVIRWLKDLGFYLENEMQASAVASCFTAAITTDGGASDGGLGGRNSGDDGATNSGNGLEYLQPGMIFRLMQGESVEVINPNRPNSQADPWIRLIMRAIAMGFGISYERLARDYSQTNFSSNRASDLEDRREFRPRQQYLIGHFCAPVYQRWLEREVSAGRMPAVDIVAYLMGEDEALFTCDWQAPGWEWVDPRNQAQAAQMELDANLTTLKQLCGDRGRSYRKVLKQLAKEERLKDEMGLSAPEPAPEPEPQEPAVNDQPEEDDASDDAEEGSTDDANAVPASAG